MRGANPSRSPAEGSLNATTMATIRANRGSGDGATAQPVQQHPIILAEKLPVGIPLRFIEVRIARPGEVHEQEVEFQHAAAGTPQHAPEVAIVHGAMMPHAAEWRAYAPEWRADAPEGRAFGYTWPMTAAVKQFSRLDFIGPDASAFLQGYLTADLDVLETHRGLPMALCNIKGTCRR